MFDLMPFRNNGTNLFNYLDNIEKQFFNSFSDDFSKFRTDINDKGNKYILQAEIPGFNKEDIKIDIKDDVLIISAEHNEETENKNENYLRRERKFGSFSRSFDATGIDTQSISASYNNGVLELELPKKEPPKEEARRIDIK